MNNNPDMPVKLKIGRSSLNSAPAADIFFSFPFFRILTIPNY